MKSPFGALLCIWVTISYPCHSWEGREHNVRKCLNLCPAVRAGFFCGTWALNCPPCWKGSLKAPWTTGSLIRLKPYCPDTLAFYLGLIIQWGKKRPIEQLALSQDSELMIAWWPWFRLQRCYAVFLNSVQVPRRKTPVSYVGFRYSSQHMTSPTLPSLPNFIWRGCKENCATLK